MNTTARIQRDIDTQRRIIRKTKNLRKQRAAEKRLLQLLTNPFYEAQMDEAREMMEEMQR